MQISLEARDSFKANTDSKNTLKFGLRATIFFLQFTHFHSYCYTTHDALCGCVYTQICTVHMCVHTYTSMLVKNPRLGHVIATQ